MTIRCPAQLLISTTVCPAPSYFQGETIGEVIKEGWCGGHRWKVREEADLNTLLEGLEIT